MKRKRFKRSEEVANRNNRYRPVDEAVLTAVAKHHYAKGTFIQALLADKDRTVRGSIRKLFDMELIGKMAPISYNFSHIYYITDAGLTKLRHHPPKTTNLIRHKGATLPTNYYHSLMVCDGTQNIEIGANKYDDRILCLSKILALLKDPVPKPMSFPYTATFQYKAKNPATFTGRANPDNALAITYKGNGQSYLILMEAERQSPDYRSNLESGSLIRKILAYEDICYNRATMKGRIKTTIQQLGQSDCHVLFTYPTEEEATRARDKVVQVLGKVLPKSKRFLFGVQPTYDNPFTDPKPDATLYDQPLLRIGLDPIALKDLWQE